MTRTQPRRSPNQPSTANPFNYATLAIMGAIFALGIGLGILFSSTTTLNPVNVASQSFIDSKAPDPEICVQFGASAIAVDVHYFVTLNPFNAYVSQPIMQPACVLRRNNWSLLERRNLVDGQNFRQCKNRMNTFAFIGDLNGDPRVDCVYQNDSAKNLFLDLQPGEAPPETEEF